MEHAQHVPVVSPSWSTLLSGGKESSNTYVHLISFTGRVNREIQQLDHSWQCVRPSPQSGSSCLNNPPKLKGWLCETIFSRAMARLHQEFNAMHCSSSSSNVDEQPRNPEQESTPPVPQQASRNYLVIIYPLLWWKESSLYCIRQAVIPAVIPA